MTCNAMLELMLGAEPEELEGRGTTVLAAHVRACEKCGRVAKRVLADSRALGVAIVAQSPVISLAERRARRRRTRTVLVLAVAAVALVAVMLRAPSRDDRRPAASTPPAVAVASNDVGAAASPVTGAIVGQRLESTRYPDATPVVAEPMSLPAPDSAPQVLDDQPTVRVEVPAGVRAVVMQPANPSITIVWMY